MGKVQLIFLIVERSKWQIIKGAAHRNIYSEKFMEDIKGAARCNIFVRRV
jgi:hypothetical protein